jgi:hypothetical protein
VISLELKDGSYILGQLLKKPFIVFFWAFADSDEWSESAADDASPMLFVSVTDQFLKFSRLRAHPDLRPAQFAELPKYWIEGFHGSRKVTVWPGTPRERTFIDLSERSGGRLIQARIDARGFEPQPVIMNSIPLDDDATIDKYETNSIWIFPHLNERLYLSKKLGRVVDPDKDIMFDRPLPDEYATYIDMRASHGTLEDWGYSIPRKDDVRVGKQARQKSSGQNAGVRKKKSP